MKKVSMVVFVMTSLQLCLLSCALVLSIVAALLCLLLFGSIRYEYDYGRHVVVHSICDN